MAEEYEGKLVAPFELYSSSVDTGYASVVSRSFKPNIDITNLHEDVYGNDKTTGFQTPFSNQHVGGHQRRHQPINDGTDTQNNRAEAFYIRFPNGNLEIQGSGYISNSSGFEAGPPHARYYRDEYSKRPFNIKNIKTLTSSNVVGNYTNDFEIVQSSGRKGYNPEFVDLEGFDVVESYNPVLNITQNYTKVRRTGSKNIIIERFSAPGSKYSNGDADGGQGLDAVYSQYSPYSTINYRKYDARYKTVINGNPGGLQVARSVVSQFGGLQTEYNSLLLDGLVYFYDSFELAKYYSHGDKVSFWPNSATSSLSFQERTMYQNSSSWQPTFQTSSLPGGRPSVYFSSGSSTWLDGGSGSIFPQTEPPEFTMYFVMKNKAVVGNGDFMVPFSWGIYGSDYLAYWIQYETSTGFGLYNNFYSNGVGGFDEANTYIYGIDDDQWSRNSYVFNSTSHYGYRNNVLPDDGVDDLPPDVDFSFILGQETGFVVGASSGVYLVFGGPKVPQPDDPVDYNNNEFMDYFFEGDIAAILIYHKVHTQDEVRQVQKYINIKYFGEDLDGNYYEIQNPSPYKVQRNPRCRLEYGTLTQSQEYNVVPGADSPILSLQSGDAKQYSLGSGTGLIEGTSSYVTLTPYQAQTSFTKSLGTGFISGTTYDLYVRWNREDASYTVTSDTFRTLSDEALSFTSDGLSYSQVKFAGPTGTLIFTLAGEPTGNLHASYNAAASYPFTESLSGSGAQGWEFYTTSSATLSYVTESVSGSYGLSLTALTASDTGMSYSFPTISGSKYDVKIWAKRGSIGTKQMIRYWEGFSETIGSNITGTTFGRYDFTVTATSSAGKIVVWANNSFGPGSNVANAEVIIDQVEIIPYYYHIGDDLYSTDPTYGGANALTLRGLGSEANSTGIWNRESNSGGLPTLSVSSDAAVGDYSLLVTGPTASSSGPRVSIYLDSDNFESGSLYDIEFWYKCEGSNSNQYIFFTNLNDPVTQIATTAFIANASYNQWTAFGKRVLSNGSTAVLRFYTHNGTPSGSNNIYLDGLTIRKVGGPVITVDEISIKSLQIDGIVTGCIYDNANISHNLIGSDFQYRWINESAINYPLGYATSSSEISFVSSSQVTV